MFTNKSTERIIAFAAEPQRLSFLSGTSHLLRHMANASLHLHMKLRPKRETVVAFVVNHLFSKNIHIQAHHTDVYYFERWLALLGTLKRLPNGHHDERHSHRESISKDKVQISSRICSAASLLRFRLHSFIYRSSEQSGW